jgi:predicted transcriptional regulator
MNNAERFLQTYNEIDRLLRNYGSGRYESYSDKIRRSKVAVIRKFRDKLLDYGELRNAIVHTPGDDYIAIPIDSAVEEFEMILQQVQSPRTVFPQFEFEVRGVRRSNRLADLLKIMRRHSYSQIPVLDDNRNVIEIINSNTVARWLARNINEDGIIENPPVSALFNDIEFRENYRFIAKNSDIYSVANLFTEQIRKLHRHLDAVFITQNGLRSERIIGLITAADVAELFD